MCNCVLGLYVKHGAENIKIIIIGKYLLYRGFFFILFVNKGGSQKSATSSQKKIKVEK